MHYKYIISQNNNPYFNLAMEQYLFEKANDDTTILFLWQNENTIVIGRNQEPYIECRAHEFLADGGKIARRKSGGGAVYHDMGNLNYSIISTIKNSEKCKYYELIPKVLLHFDIPVEFNNRNDLVIQNQKVSGNAFYTHNQIICQHGTILFNTDIDKMSYYLTPDINKLTRNCVHSVSSRVINLSQLNSKLTIEKIHSTLIKLTDATPIEIDENHYIIKKHEKSFASSDWIFRRTFK